LFCDLFSEDSPNASRVSVTTFSASAATWASNSATRTRSAAFRVSSSASAVLTARLGEDDRVNVA